MAQPLFSTPFSNKVYQINLVAGKVVEKWPGQAWVRRVLWYGICMLGISHVVDGVATFANAKVYQIDLVAEKVAGSTQNMILRRYGHTEQLRPKQNDHGLPWATMGSPWEYAHFYLENA